MTNDTARDYDVVISGASYAGLALALGLARSLGAGARLALIDNGKAPAGSDTRAFAIWAASKNVLDVLGVWDEIAPDVQTILAIEISDSALEDGVRQTRLTYEALTADGAPAGYIVPASTLSRALKSAVLAQSAVEWLSGREARDLALEDPVARVTLDDGKVVKARLVAAADGRNSRLRDAAGLKTTGWGYGQTGIVATVAFTEPHGGIAIQHFLPGGPFAILPMTGNRACITWSCEESEARRVLALPDDAFLMELDTRIGGRFGPIRLCGPRQSWPLELKMARELAAHRFVVLGDAAHGVHPVAGQGVNLALRDVAALVESMTEAARIGLDAGGAETLARYVRWRRFDNVSSAAAYDGLNRFFGIDDVLLRAGRGAVLNLLDRLPMLKQLVMTEAAGLSGDVPKMLKGESV